MKLGKKVCKFLVLSMVLVGITGCSPAGKQATTAGAGLEKLGAVTVVSREEGSGTREVFAESIGFYDFDMGRDLTTDNAVFSMSGEKVIDIVKADPAAIGYVSKGVLANVAEPAVREVTVDGSNLERRFYLAYSGELSDVERDFVAYVKGAGQEIVGQNHTAIRKSTTFLCAQPSGAIKIGGSSSVAGLMEELARAYMQINPNASIEVVATDSTDGLTGAVTGIYDLGISSRDLKDYEKELLEYAVIAKDEVSVIVHADNPLENISSQDLKAIYTGDITAWNQLVYREANHK